MCLVTCQKSFLRTFCLFSLLSPCSSCSCALKEVSLTQLSPTGPLNGNDGRSRTEEESGWHPGLLNPNYYHTYLLVPGDLDCKLENNLQNQTAQRPWGVCFPMRSVGLTMRCDTVWASGGSSVSQCPLCQNTHNHLLFKVCATNSLL